MGVVLYLLVIDLNIPGPATDVDILYYPNHLLSQWLVVSTYEIPLRQLQLHVDGDTPFTNHHLLNEGSLSVLR